MFIIIHFPKIKVNVTHRFSEKKINLCEKGDEIGDLTVFYNSGVNSVFGNLGFQRRNSLTIRSCHPLCVLGGGGGEAVGISEQNLVNLLENYNNRFFFSFFTPQCSRFLPSCCWLSQVGTVPKGTVLYDFSNVKTLVESRL